MGAVRTPVGPVGFVGRSGRSVEMRPPAGGVGEGVGVGGVGVGRRSRRDESASLSWSTGDRWRRHLVGLLRLAVPYLPSVVLRVAAMEVNEREQEHEETRTRTNKENEQTREQEKGTYARSVTATRISIIFGYSPVRSTRAFGFTSRFGPLIGQKHRCG